MKVLIISPHFPPTNAADMQRVRLILPYLADEGVSAEVLAVEPEQVAAPQDPWLCEGLPKGVPIHRVRALGLKWMRVPGLGTLTFRAKGAIRKRVDELVQTSGFDLIYFSTTLFAINALGPHWKKRFGIPFVVDYQDPWVNDYYRDHPEVKPPGGRLKYGLVNRLSRWQEPRVLRECSGITSVSGGYPEQLQDRYSWLDLHGSGVESRASREEVVLDEGASSSSPALTRLPFAILPFPGDLRDLELAAKKNTSQSVFDPNDGSIHWVYIGVCPVSMVGTLRSFFRAFVNLQRRKSNHWDRIQLHFVGTSYAAAGRGQKVVMPIAEEFGLVGRVHESTDRIRFSEMLRCLRDADALLVPGTNDPTYTASKIYPYLLAEKPLLAIFHENSLVVKLFEEVGGGTCLTFSDSTAEDELAEKIREVISRNSFSIPKVPLNREALSDYLAPAQAKKLAGFFKRCLEVGERNHPT